jgi:hypothetical protein
MMMLLGIVQKGKVLENKTNEGEDETKRFKK